MPASVTTKEIFPATTNELQLKEEVKLRLKAGAIKSWYERSPENFILFTEWNVIGEQ